MSQVSLTTWTLKSRQEPLIRVGLVLPEDAMDSIAFDLPDVPYRISAGGWDLGSRRAVRARVVTDDQSVTLRTDTCTLGPAEVLTVTPENRIRPEQHAGICLRQFRTGRGFHWEKLIDASFAGALEFRVCRGHLVVVNVLSFEDYLLGVISGEMSGACPLEFLKSQCVVARSWALARTEDKHPGLPFDRCGDDCCQRYHGTNDLTAAVVEAGHFTRGQVLVGHRGGLIDANYSKSCGGIIEAPEHVWAVTKEGQRAAVDAPDESAAQDYFPLSDQNLATYLSAGWPGGTDVFCSPQTVPEEELSHYLSRVDVGGHYFRWQEEYKREELERILKKKYFRRQNAGSVAPMARLDGLQVLRRGASGRANLLEIAYLDDAGERRTVRLTSEYAIREALHEKFLYSSAFRIETEHDSEGMLTCVRLIGAGWGHGAGMCQIGALGMALQGYNWDSIVKHYFAGVDIAVCY